MKKNIKKLLALICLFSVFNFSSCQFHEKQKAQIKTENNFSQTKISAQKNSSISVQDFTISYQGVILNDKVPMKEIAKHLGLDLEILREKEQFVVECGSNIPGDGNQYIFYKAMLPSQTTPEIMIYFWYNSTQKKFLRLTNMTLFSPFIKTNRGISVGDDELSLKRAYGETIHVTNLGDSIFYETDIPKSHEYNITFTIDPIDKKIISIDFDYNSNQIMEELGLDGFD